VVSEPALGRSWANGVANPLQWSKGLRDGVPNFDIEMARMTTDGISYVARNGACFWSWDFSLSVMRCSAVPATTTALNIFLQDVPPGDDYYMLFINSSHGVLYAISPRFSIVSSSSASNSSLASVVASAPTVTLSGPPNPTASFATMYPETSDSIPSSWVGMGGWLSSVFTIFCGAMAGALLLFM
jgi:hypothetical protein